MACVLALVAAGCLSDRRGPSIWPPEDFYLEVHAQAPLGDGALRVQRFQVWSDGLAVYRESDRALESGSLRVPIFHRTCAYVLDTRSIRTLGRLLDRGGLYDLENDTDSDRNQGDEDVVVVWRCFERRGFAMTDTRAVGGIDRSLHIINSFLPVGRAFRYADLAGETEGRHVGRVPEPLDSVPGAFWLHRELAKRHPDDLSLRLDLFALAIEAGDTEFALKMLDVIEGFEPEPVFGEVLAPDDWEQTFLMPLRAMLDSRAR